MENLKLEKLRQKLRENNIDAFYITGSDAHLSEYVAPRWKSREYLTSFTGSAGYVIVTMNDAVLFTDSRYFIQAKKEIENTGFIMLRLETEDLDPLSFLKTKLKKGDVVAVEKSEISIKQFKDMSISLKKDGINLIATDGIISSIWPERPSVPFSKVRDFNAEYAGKSSREKIEEVREELRKKKAEWTLISSLDDIAWLTNLRADDIPYNPVFYAFFFLSLDEAILFTNKERFERLDSYDFEIRDYFDAYSLTKEDVKGIAYYNDEKTSMSFYHLFSENDITGRDITTDLKACKNENEINGMKKSHKEDAVAYVNFLSKLYKNKPSNEIEISERLEKERKRRKGYLGPSFAPISAFKENGAMCHYSATEDSNKVIDTSSLLVLDTGSQFEYGTTDITRTLLFGEAKDDEKRDYTLVLKGHLALSRQKFIKGTRGVQLDILAKQFLFNDYKSFFHGTGHGVGCALNVHEGPARISSALIDVPLKPGMVLSDEPGLYKEGEYGIRIENLLLVKDDEESPFGEFYSFEVLTLVPYERDLIDVSLLTKEEIDQIDTYHKMVWDELNDKVDEDSLPYLKKATSPICYN